jgi:tRNA (guanine-N7-)-methyltransferase
MLFGRRAPRALEIGSGNGENVLARALAQEGWDFLAVEVHRPGVGHLFNRAAAIGTTNLRVCIADARAVVAHLPAQSIDTICIYFPDPWPKLRHRKRRLVQAGFLAELAHCLARHGRLYLATDIEDYAEDMAAAIEAVPGLVNLAGIGARAPRPRQRILTRFEQRGLDRGHAIHDFVVARRD